ncbi:TlpA family protein disulfide reductase [Brevibacterium jeotgali]|uniref:Thiol-disulfide isomerase or thioredoxin n=1 Tax=Brevibacterium jeotgali TaxID=1262550 RepID=A0A2H1L0V5_9MICO|nr:TlpA disulfide reductase family protein [Brevibacterium jeotgali]TWC02116.1 thiol-disulfide isomerase/thioredoxin [Brevibacterium jeotgali]SMY10534.1 Thiol-disulfide isomerase or thioredoxin [Brevibacterium jeotgali]
MTRLYGDAGREGLGRLDRLAGIDRIPTRRGALGLLGLSSLALAGCGSGSEDLAQQAQSGGDKGYVSGSGVITQLSGDERGEPLDLDFETLAGDSTSLAAWRPRVVAINLWYAACPPCRVEAPDLHETYESFGDQVEFLGVNVRDQAATAESFVRTFEVPYPIMIDGDGSMVSLLSSVLPPQATPSTVILDASGRAAARVVGAVTRSTLTGLIEDVLAQ